MKEITKKTIEKMILNEQFEDALGFLAGELETDSKDVDALSLCATCYRSARDYQKAARYAELALQAIIEKNRIVDVGSVLKDLILSRFALKQYSEVNNLAEYFSDYIKPDPSVSTAVQTSIFFSCLSDLHHYLGRDNDKIVLSYQDEQDYNHLVQICMTILDKWGQLENRNDYQNIVQEVADVLLSLGETSLSGSSQVNQDIGRAYRIFDKLDTMRVPEALYYQGLSALEGITTPKDPETALAYFNEFLNSNTRRNDLRQRAMQVVSQFNQTDPVVHLEEIMATLGVSETGDPFELMESLKGYAKNKPEELRDALLQKQAQTRAANSNNYLDLFALLDNLLSQDNPKQGKKVIDSLLTYAPFDSDSWAALGRLSLVEGQREIARYAYDTALFIDPSNPKASPESQQAVLSRKEAEKVQDLKKRLAMFHQAKEETTTGLPRITPKPAPTLTEEPVLPSIAPAPTLVPPAQPVQNTLPPLVNQPAVQPASPLSRTLPNVEPGIEPDVPIFRPAKTALPVQPAEELPAYAPKKSGKKPLVDQPKPQDPDLDEDEDDEDEDEEGSGGSKVWIIVLVGALIVGAVLGFFVWRMLSPKKESNNDTTGNDEPIEDVVINKTPITFTPIKMTAETWEANGATVQSTAGTLQVLVDTTVKVRTAPNGTDTGERLAKGEYAVKGVTTSQVAGYTWVALADDSGYVAVIEGMSVFTPSDGATVEMPEGSALYYDNLSWVCDDGSTLTLSLENLMLSGNTYYTGTYQSVGDSFYYAKVQDSAGEWYHFYFSIVNERFYVSPQLISTQADWTYYIQNNPDSYFCSAGH